MIFSFLITIFLTNTTYATSEVKINKYARDLAGYSSFREWCNRVHYCPDYYFCCPDLRMCCPNGSFCCHPKHFTDSLDVWDCCVNEKMPTNNIKGFRKTGSNI
uniref:Cysteine rich secreted protein n=1 Tax=Riptortus pedestris TaxID=329032 RepID=R4WD62_RIPPE|nr:cysteine rich secreted protein [Riptortus pedestris]